MAKESFTAIFDAEDNLSGVLSGMGSNASGLEGTLSKLAKTAATVFTTKQIVDFGKECVNASHEFESGMAEVFTLMPDLSSAAMSQMKADTKDFVKETGTSVSDATSALYQAISAGVPKENVFDFLETANKAAVGGVSDLTTAVDGLSSVTNAYGSDTLSAQQASDLMFTTVKLGKTTFGELASSLYNVVPTAVGAGVAFSDISASLAAMTAQGVPTSVATTQLRQAIVELSKSGTDTDKTFRKLAGKGFKEYIAEGHNLQQVFQLLEKHAAKSGLGINDLFGSVEAGNAVLALTGNGTEKFTQAIEAMGNSAGATETAYNTMEQTAERKIEKMKAQWEVMKVEIGGALSDALIPVMDALSANMPQITAAMGEFGGLMVNAVNSAIPAFEFLIDNIDMVKTAIEGLAIGFASAKIASGIISIVTAVSKLKTAISSLGALKALVSVFGAGGIITAGAAAVGVLGYGIYKAYQHSKKFGSNMNEVSEEFGSHIEQMKEISALQSEFGELELVVNSNESSVESVEDAKQRIEEIRDLLADDYNLNVSCDTSELENALELIGEKEFQEAKSSRNSLMIGLESGKDDYDKAIREIHEQEGKIRSANEAMESDMRMYNMLSANGDPQAEKYLKSAEKWSNFKEGLENNGAYKRNKEEVAAYDDNARKAVENSYSVAEYSLKNGKDASYDIEELGRALQFTGESASTYADRLVLASLGMNSFDQVAKSGQGTISSYISNFADIGQQLGMTSEDITNFAQSIGAIGESQHIEITASGDVSVIDDITNKLTQFSNDNISVSLNAEGDISILDEASGKMQTLTGMGAANLQLNADGNIDILNEASQVMGTINSETAQLSVNADFSGQAELQAAADASANLSDKSSTIAVIGAFNGQDQIQSAVDLGGQLTDIVTGETVNGVFNDQDKIAAAISYQGQLADRTVTYTVNYAQNGTPPSNNESFHGNSNFPIDT